MASRDVRVPGSGRTKPGRVRLQEKSTNRLKKQYAVFQALIFERLQGFYIDIY
jgi:hypothetical protein